MQTRASCASNSSRVQEPHVVRRDDGSGASCDECEHSRDVRFFARPTGALDLEVVPVAEEFLPAREDCIRFGGAAREQGAADIPLRSAGQGNQPAGRVGVQPFAREHGPAAVLALEVAARHQSSEVPESAGVLRKQRQKHGLGTLAAVGDPEIRADDRLHAPLLRFTVELDHREQVAVVRQGHGRHACGRDRTHESGYADDPVHERILGVQPQVYERGAARAGLGRWHAAILPSYRRKTLPVQPAGADARQLLQVVRSRVTLVALETVLRKYARHARHPCVTAGLREDRGCADFAHTCVAANDCLDAAGEAQHGAIRAAVAVDADRVRA